MKNLIKYKYWLLTFVILELCLFVYLSNGRENKIQKYVEKQSSIIQTNYNTIQNIYAKIPNAGLNSIDTFSQLKIEMQKFFEIDIHILINKNAIISTNTQYIKSEEHPNYFYKRDFLKIGEDKSIAIKKFNKKLLRQIDENIKKQKNFSIYKFSNNPISATFIPLTKDIYLVAYQKSPELKDIQLTFILLLVFGSLGFVLLFLFIYKLKNEQRLLEIKVSKKTKQFKELNESLEHKIDERTNEQSILLSLFDKGDIVLFKWKNDDIWKVEHVSKSVEKLFDYKAEDFLSGKTQYANIIHKDDLVYFIKEVEYAVKTKEDFFIHKPYRIITKEGNVKWIKDYTVSVKNEKGDIINFVGYLNDITVEVNHKIELENEVKEKTKSLKELNDNLAKQIEIEIHKNLEKEKLMFQQSKMASMGEMLANIAHQWRQPLNSISISASSLQLQKELDQLTDEIFQYGIDGIIESTDFLSSTIDDFQNFLKPNNKISHFDLNYSIEKSLQLVVATFKKKSITTIFNIPSVTITGVQGEFTQVILNILNNAKDILIETNDVDNRIIFIDAILLKEEVLINIKDNAGGIPEDIIGNIFDQYFTTKDIDGTGIGLHMSKEIIESHMNGKLEVKNEEYKFENKLHKGAKFTITLPIEKNQN